MFLLQWVGVVAEHSLCLSSVQHIVRYPGLLSTVPILIPVQLCPRNIFRTVIEVMVEVCVVFYMLLYGWPVPTDSTKTNTQCWMMRLYFTTSEHDELKREKILDNDSPFIKAAEWAHKIIKLSRIKQFYLLV